MKLRLFGVFVVILFLSFKGFSKNGFQIEKGTLDLSQINIADYSSIKLEGNIEFYWNQLLEPKDFRNGKAPINGTIAKIPKSWTSVMLDSSKLSNEGYATYRLVIKKQPDTDETIYGLKIATVFSNYKLWANGKFLTEVGTVGINKESAFPKFKYQDIPIILDPDKGATDSIELIFQVSNYNHVRAGLQRPIFFGTFDNLRKETRNNDILNLIIIGIILIIGLNHLNMFFFRRKDVSNLYFSIVCLVMILRNITTADRIITNIFPNISWELLIKLDNFSGFGTIPLFALFIYSLFSKDFSKHLRNIMVVLGIIITIIVFATPAVVYGKIRLVFEVYILIFGLYLTFGILLKAAIRKRPTAFWTFLAMFILYSTAINDVLSSMGVIQSAYIASYGLVAFMLIQSTTITSKSAKAINQNEKLTKELTTEKENLEKNINERTQELQKQHDELIQHQEKEKQQSWINNGVAIVNDILADNKDDFKVLSNKILVQLIKYINGLSGVLYMMNEDDDEKYFELIADYGCSNDIRKGKAKIYSTTGNFGIAYSENRVLVIDDVPENYLKIESGLGNGKPQGLLIVPLSIDEKVFGMIELASFEKFTSIQVEFIKRVANNIAGNLNNIRMNENSAEMIKKFKAQTQEMMEKEEEMRQNMEEMEAIREQYEELRKKHGM